MSAVRGPVRRAFDESVTEARKQKLVGGLDTGVVRAAQKLADKIDAWDRIVQFALEDVDDFGLSRPAVPAHDNTSFPTFLKYCEALGLTPTSASRPAAGVSGEVDSPVERMRRARAERVKEVRRK